ncbi:hypothetical protein ACOJIU_12620 [Carnobacterium maltaromaticum]|uniref:hypothetical protein n=1 Tax=Carnobacterium maltaromaticum TaxID=2751 RepID=UPI003B984584
MTRYRKKPVVIEAFKYDGDFKKSTREYYVPDWAISNLEAGILSFEGQGDLFINTLEGKMFVSVGDYIIQGVQGELYPCKPDIFEQTYELA